MRKILTLCAFIFYETHSNAQDLSPQMISNAGDYNPSSYYNLSWSIGEPVIETNSTSGVILTQGFHQTNYYVTLLEKYGSQAINVYPNPISDIINVETNSKEITIINLMDAAGKLIRSETFQNKTKIDASGLSHGSYLLQLYDKNNFSVQLFKIQKTN